MSDCLFGNLPVPHRYHLREDFCIFQWLKELASVLLCPKNRKTLFYCSDHLRKTLNLTIEHISQMIDIITALKYWACLL